MDPLQCEIRQVWFLETPDLALDKAGVVVRARRSQRKGDDTVVKLRPVVPSELPKAVRAAPNVRRRGGRLPAAFVCSGSMKGAPAAGTVLEAMAGERRCASCSRRPQRALFAAHAPEGVTLDDLKPSGRSSCSS